MRGRVGRLRSNIPAGLLFGGLAAALLLTLGEAAPGWFPLRLTIEARGGAVSVDVDGAHHELQRPVDGWTRVRLEAPGPEQREVQIDGSDTVGRGDRDADAIRSIEHTPLYAVVSWLRDDSSFSRWDDATWTAVRRWRGGPKR